MPHYESIRTGDPYRKAVAVTPSDTVDLAPPARGLLVTSIAGGATLAFIPADNADSETVAIVPTANQIIPMFVRRVMATGTAATVMALY